jgi:hypothetical protein
MFAVPTLLVILFGCSAPKPGDDVIHIDPTTWATQTVSLDDIIKEIRLVPLETKPQSMLGTILEIQLAKDRIYIRQDEKIVSFTEKGKFIRSFGSQGKGPGEFFCCNNIIVNEAKAELLANDVNNKKFLYFDLDGNFLREQKLKYTGMILALLMPDILCNHAGRISLESEKYEMAFLDWNGNVTQKHFPFKQMLGIDAGSGFANGLHSNSRLYTKMADYHIYELSPDRIDTLLTLDFGEAAVDTSLLSSPNDVLRLIWDPKKILGMTNLVNTSSHLGGSIIMRGIRGLWLFDWHSREHRLLPADSTQVFGTYERIPVHVPIQTWDDWFITTIDGIDWFESISQLPEADKIKLRKRIPGFTEAEKVDQDGNPILIFFKFKEF